MNFVLIPNQTYENLNIQSIALLKGFNLSPRTNKTFTHKAVHVSLLDQIGNNVLLSLLDLSRDQSNDLKLVNYDYLNTDLDWADEE